MLSYLIFLIYIYIVISFLTAALGYEPFTNRLGKYEAWKFYLPLGFLWPLSLPFVVFISIAYCLENKPCSKS